MRKSFIAVSFAALAALPAVAALADSAPPPYTLSANVTLTSEYIYRGIAQSNRYPAIQGGFDFSHSSGFYLGTWGSSISWLSDEGAGSFPMEWDFYGGFKTQVAKDVTIDVGGLEYYYPGHLNAGFANPDTFEIYAAVGWKWLTLKYSDSTTNLFGWTTPSGDNTRGSGYVDLAGSWDLGGGWGVSAHVGHQNVKGFADASYTDWKLGASKDVGFGSVELDVIGTNAKGDPGQPYYNAYGKDLGKTRVVLSFSKTF